VTETCYVVYEVGTGEIVHVHTDVDLASTSEEILQVADPSGERQLEVLELPDGHPPAEGARVVNGELETARDSRETRGRGDAGAEAEFPEPLVERQYERRRGK
jgi:hypothetical protein